MTNFIRFEYLLACAFVVTEANAITMRELNDFRVLVETEFEKRSIDARFLFTSKYAEEAIYDYPNLFQFDDEYGTTIMRKPDVTNAALIQKFFAYLSVDDLSAVIAVSKEHFSTNGFN